MTSIDPFFAGMMIVSLIALAVIMLAVQPSET